MSKWYLIKNQTFLREIYKHISTSIWTAFGLSTIYYVLARYLFFLVDSRLKISLEKKSRQIQAESSDFILNPGHSEVFSCWVSFVSTFSAFIQQHAFVSSLFRIQTSRPSCGKTYFALSPFVFKITGRQSANDCFSCRLLISPFSKINVISP